MALLALVAFLALRLNITVTQDVSPPAPAPRPPNLWTVAGPLGHDSLLHHWHSHLMRNELYAQMAASALTALPNEDSTIWGLNYAANGPVQSRLLDMLSTSRSGPAAPRLMFRHTVGWYAYSLHQPESGREDRSVVCQLHTLNNTQGQPALTVVITADTFRHTPGCTLYLLEHIPTRQLLHQIFFNPRLVFWVDTTGNAATRFQNGIQLCGYLINPNQTNRTVVTHGRSDSLLPILPPSLPKVWRLHLPIEVMSAEALAIANALGVRPHSTLWRLTLTVPDSLAPLLNDQPTALSYPSHEWPMDGDGDAYMQTYYKWHPTLASALVPIPGTGLHELRLEFSPTAKEN